MKTVVLKTDALIDDGWKTDVWKFGLWKSGGWNTDGRRADDQEPLLSSLGGCDADLPMGITGNSEPQIAGSELTGADFSKFEPDKSEFAQSDLTETGAAEIFLAGADKEDPASDECFQSPAAGVSPGAFSNPSPALCPSAALQPSSAPQSSAAQLPRVASSILVPPLPGASAQQAGSEPGSEPGGEWELLVSKWQTWWTSGELMALASQARKPSLLLVGLLALLLLLRLYAGLLAALESLPLLPGLLELVAVIWLVRYGGPRLLHREERQRLIAALASRWRGFWWAEGL